ITTIITTRRPATPVGRALRRPATRAIRRPAKTKGTTKTSTDAPAGRARSAPGEGVENARVHGLSRIVRVERQRIVRQPPPEASPLRAGQPRLRIAHAPKGNARATLDGQARLHDVVRDRALRRQLFLARALDLAQRHVHLRELHREAERREALQVLA